MSESRYVLDTNVLVSGLLFPDSLPGQAFAEARRQGYILLSEETIDEIGDILRRPKFDRYVLPEDRDRFLAALIRQAKLLQPTVSVFARVVIRWMTSGWSLQSLVKLAI